MKTVQSSILKQINEHGVTIFLKNWRIHKKKQKTIDLKKLLPPLTLITVPVECCWVFRDVIIFPWKSKIMLEKNNLKTDTGLHILDETSFINDCIWNLFICFFSDINTIQHGSEHISFFVNPLNFTSIKTLFKDKNQT